MKECFRSTSWRVTIIFINVTLLDFCRLNFIEKDMLAKFDIPYFTPKKHWNSEEAVFKKYGYWTIYDNLISPGPPLWFPFYFHWINRADFWLFNRLRRKVLWRCGKASHLTRTGSEDTQHWPSCFWNNWTNATWFTSLEKRVQTAEISSSRPPPSLCPYGQHSRSRVLSFY